MKRGGGSVIVSALLLAAAPLGCGGRPDGLPPAGIMPAPATCGTVAPCGGDVTGTWKVLGGCIPNATAPGACTQVEIQTLSFAGTATFNPDLTYTAPDFTEIRAEVDTTPVSCWGGYQMRTCAQEDQALKAQVGPVGTLSYASCTGSSTCACTVAETAAQVLGDSGTYSLQGSLINFSSVSGPFSSLSGLSYCVQDGLFHLLEATTVVDGSGVATTSVYSDIVLQLQ
jgi:hypothetical protein